MRLEWLNGVASFYGKIGSPTRLELATTCTLRNDAYEYSLAAQAAHTHGKILITKEEVHSLPSPFCFVGRIL